jgi:hypothetical protein
MNNLKEKVDFARRELNIVDATNIECIVTSWQGTLYDKSKINQSNCFTSKIELLQYIPNKFILKELFI